MGRKKSQESGAGASTRKYTEKQLIALVRGECGDHSDFLQASLYCLKGNIKVGLSLNDIISGMKWVDANPGFSKVWEIFLGSVAMTSGLFSAIDEETSLPMDLRPMKFLDEKWLVGYCFSLLRTWNDMTEMQVDISNPEPWDNPEKQAFLQQIIETMSLLEESIGGSLSDITLNKFMAITLVCSVPDSALASYSDEELSFFHSALEYLVVVDPDNENFLSRIAFGYCKGNRIFEKDPAKAREMFDHILSLNPKDPSIYHTALGAIYLSGEADGGSPDYEKAFMHLVPAAFCGNTEAMYSVSDMYRKGQYVTKDDHASYSLLNMAYHECMKQYMGGNTESRYAECAFRMGLLYRDGIGTVTSDYLACIYFLQALFALDDRIEGRGVDSCNEGDPAFCADQELGEEIEKCLKETRERLDFGNLPEKYRMQGLAHIIEEGLRMYGRMKCRIFRKGRGKTARTVVTFSVPGTDNESMLLFASPEDRGACMTGHISVVVPGSMENDDDEFIFEEITDEDLFAVLEECNGFRFVSPLSTDTFYRIVTCKLSGDCRTNDYLLQDQEVVLYEGAQVSVETPDGPKVAKVISEALYMEEELRFKPSTYKRVLSCNVDRISLKKYKGEDEEDSDL